MNDALSETENVFSAIGKQITNSGYRAISHFKVDLETVLSGYLERVLFSIKPPCGGHDQRQ